MIFLKASVPGPQLLTPYTFSKAVLSKCYVIENVYDELKNLCQIEHSRHSLINNFIAN
ncbi:hypothetical protein PH97_004477 [Salmonella enterica subsp. enterica]|nr:hypothetical protein [Salmonella enterica]EBK2664761.1 hypothetical protein [Salmonella enterica subsp. enterica serovar Enteritidis]EDW1488844.1 hypothetical protein [Salmonella enterica subsp. enterica serovar Hvittingfoss]HAU2969580.1 hypothetical protein [Salmonella enterica subsp. diarizonae]EAU6352123.1 hypothetical protein [Salmonella enterica]